MKLIFSLTLTWLIYLNSAGQKFYDTTYFPNGQIQRYGKFDKIKKCWIETKYFYNGKIADTKIYDSSNFNYKYSLTAYNMNGTVAAKVNFKQGLPDGEFEEYYSNGSKKRIGNYFKGFKIGKWKEYFLNGKLSDEYFFSLTKKDSMFNTILSFQNVDSLGAKREEIKWGEKDATLGANLEWINLTKFDFYYLNSEPSGVWKKYNSQGKEMNRIDYDRINNKRLKNSR